jgi:diguanylate cyclase (GGDEF)-like protein
LTADHESAEAGRRATDPVEPELFDALLRVHRHLDSDDVYREILGCAVGWSGAQCGFVYRPADRPGRLSPSIDTLGEGDPRRGVLRDLDDVRADDLVGAAPERVFDGLGPFGLESVAWPDADVTNTVAIPVRGRDAEAAAVLVLVEPSDADRSGIHRFLRATRPAVANAASVAAMRELIIQDDTAGCFNRRHFEASLPEELSRAQRFRAPASLIFFDLDNLKQVNSRHGHAMGSRTLYEVSVRVRAKIRKFDKLFRFGGDEFCILLPETEWHGALEVAERVREAIAVSPFLTGLVADPEGIVVTASFGIASFPLHARTKEDMVVQADRAMQRIKNGTKNSIAIAEIVGDSHEP